MSFLQAQGALSQPFLLVMLKSAGDAEHLKKHFPAVSWGYGSVAGSVLAAPKCLKATISVSHRACCHTVSWVLISWGWEEQLMKKYKCSGQRQSFNTGSVPNSRKQGN